QRNIARVQQSGHLPAISNRTEKPLSNSRLQSVTLSYFHLSHRALPQGEQPMWTLSSTVYGKHKDPADSDGHKPDRPIPPPTPNDGGSGDGKHERDDK